MATFETALKPKLIYVFRINDSAHKGALKIGETTADLTADYFTPNSNGLNAAARKRIDQYTKTASIAYDLLYTEAAMFNTPKGIKSFNDKKVHSVLEHSGIRKANFGKINQGTEWFMTDLETVKKAIAAVKEGRKSLNSSEVTKDNSPIVFRPEQREAIDVTIKKFKRGNNMLWNAKMRFGKTLSALQMVREMDFQRTLILTHRPVVDEGWFGDFGKIFYDKKDWSYGSRNMGESFKSLEMLAKSGSHYVYFASMQDLRGAEAVGGKFDKNVEVFAAQWDCLIVDEAHEGTKTEIGQAVINELIKQHTKVLRLSGTPFNLLDDYAEDEIYTWDYVMEQRAKAEWDLTHMGDPNPYESLPAINIYTYDLGSLMSKYEEDEKAFNFREFFRVNEHGVFTHDDDVDSFLNLLCKSDKESLYPYSNDEFRDIFRHTLWVVPGVASAKALSAKLQLHPVFGTFKIVNVAGNGDDDEENDNALQMVKDAIGKHPDETYTITLSCGRLTTGVSVKPWTGVFMMAGSFSTSASSYMQTIFRVQTPFTYNGKMKTNCYAFDFAPDRTLRVLAESAKVSAKAGKTKESDRNILGEFLNFCPIISIEGSAMRPYNVEGMMAQLKRAQIEKVVQCGFEDGALYNDELLKLSDLDLKMFHDLKARIGETKAMKPTGDIDINKQGFTNEEYEQVERASKKSKRERTPEEQALLDELKKKREMRQNVISILRGISIRMPLLIYGADMKDDEEITIDNFSSIVDDESWTEFMPAGVTKDVFEGLKRFYEADIFREAGKRIRAMARHADEMFIEERISRITEIFSFFRNPDKETVLTPWRVVNMHMSDCLGGYCFYDETYSDVLLAPRYIEQDDVTNNVFAQSSKVLEINSKSGLYPLYVAYSIYRCRADEYKQQHTDDLSMKVALELWDATVRENIFVICKTPMARDITRRTLVGFRQAKVNAQYYKDLINVIKDNPSTFVNEVRDGKRFWNANNNDYMKFDAIVGNPPYQVMDGGGANTSAISIYNLFVDIAKEFKPYYISMIMPARWYSGGKGLDDFRETMLNDRHIHTMVDYPNPKDCFPTSNISGGVCYLLWSFKYNGDCNYTNVVNGKRISTFRRLNEYDVFVRYNMALPIIRKVTHNEDFQSMSDCVSTRNIFNLASSERGSSTRSANTDLTLFSSRGKGFLSRTDVSSGEYLINKHKVFMGKVLSGHIGETDDNGQVKVVATVQATTPNDVCTDSYLVIGDFINRNESTNLETYIKTKMLRFLLLQSLTSMNISRGNFRFVPLQDFTADSDIDWSRSVREIDQQLYMKYDLTPDEIDFIERMIKPME